MSLVGDTTALQRFLLDADAGLEDDLRGRAFNSAWIATTLGWEPSRFGQAAEYGEQQGWFAFDSTMGSHQYRTNGLRLTASGRVNIESLVAVGYPTSESEPPSASTKGKAVSDLDPRKVFIIHGRNRKAYEAMRDFLRALNLQPLDFEERAATKGSPFIGDVVREVLSEAKAVIALFTPDEQAVLRAEYQDDHDQGTDRRWQARPNVIFEAGMAMGIDEDRTILVTLGPQVKLFSDADGRHVVRLDNSSKQRELLVQKLEGCGCALKRSADYATVADFVGCLPKSDDVGTNFPPKTSGVAVVSVAALMPDADVKMLLGDYLVRLDEGSYMGTSLKFEEIDRDAGVPPGSAAKLLDGVLAPRWEVINRTETLIRLGRLPQKMRDVYSSGDE